MIGQKPLPPDTKENNGLKTIFHWNKHINEYLPIISDKDIQPAPSGVCGE